MYTISGYTFVSTITGGVTFDVVDSTYPINQITK